MALRIGPTRRVEDLESDGDHGVRSEVAGPVAEAAQSWTPVSRIWNPQALRPVCGFGMPTPCRVQLGETAAD
jgi:hypothetical protein